MSLNTTLDVFLPPVLVKPKQDLGIFVEERCSREGCRKVLKIWDLKFHILVKGKLGVYCRECTRVLIPEWFAAFGVKEVS